jgi:hypothetical protein
MCIYTSIYLYTLIYIYIHIYTLTYIYIYVYTYIQDLDQEWPLLILDHNDDEHELLMKPGDMVRHIYIYIYINECVYMYIYIY